eukprot:8761178-Alexandrium_andersonii.AAC.1
MGMRSGRSRKKGYSRTPWTRPPDTIGGTPSSQRAARRQAARVTPPVARLARCHPQGPGVGAPP